VSQLDRPELARLRKKMVDEYLHARGIAEPRVLKAMEKVPRHLFVDEALRERAYGDYALPIGEKQTISQPYTVALMTLALELSGSEKVLEIGTGSGYQTAILAELADHVYSIERLPLLARRARQVLDLLGYHNIAIRILDGTYGWKDESPYDAILVSAAATTVPEPLLDQLRVGGRLVMPLKEGLDNQQLVRLVKEKSGWRQEALAPCRFVPLAGAMGRSA
jgi:protein-L-isoaspartate(D-aspartate) O-methyltransferase